MNGVSLSFRGKSSPELDMNLDSQLQVDDGPGGVSTSEVKTRLDSSLRKLKHSRGGPVLTLGVIWTLLLLYGERWYPKWTIQKCQWHRGFGRDVRVALIADPQILDENSYPWRGQLTMAVVKYIVDAYLRRNWVYINQCLDPDTNIFLGDLFDGGREWDDTRWRNEFERYNNIFTKPALKRTVMSLPGNHDIGYGDDIVKHALGRFQAFFGPGSSRVEVGNHTFVLLDTISMQNSKDEWVYKPPFEFLDSFANEENPKPHVLLTHVPLFRPPDHTCGKSREHGNVALDYTRGKQYQTLVPPDLSARILETIKPVAVFSGDDHDACHVQHNFRDKGVQRTTDEYTVKSISMAMGVAHPGIQLVTLDGAGGFSSNSLQTSICLMPSPLLAFILYGVVAIASVAALVALHLRKSSRPRDYLPLHRQGDQKPKTMHRWRNKAAFCRDFGLLIVWVLGFYFFLNWRMAHSDI